MEMLAQEEGRDSPIYKQMEGILFDPVSGTFKGFGNDVILVYLQNMAMKMDDVVKNKSDEAGRKFKAGEAAHGKRTQTENGLEVHCTRLIVGVLLLNTSIGRPNHACTKSVGSMMDVLTDHALDVVVSLSQIRCGSLPYASH